MLLVMSGLLVLRVYLSGQREYQKGLRALSQDLPDEAERHLQRAIKWYLPGAGYVELAAEKLAAVGIEARKRGDSALALRSFYELRASFLSARGFYTPGKRWIRLADREIAAIWNEKGFVQSAVPRSGNDPFWIALAPISFLGWVGSSFGLIWKGFAKNGRLLPSEAWPWYLVLTLSYALWIVAMSLA
jgi:hypothetical protein